jgi:signal transduction histidine kinase
VILKISDTGKGISPEIKDHIFEPFYTTKEGGTGLGLSITHEIIEKHKGTITVASQPGAGTEFTIHIPLVVTGNKTENHKSQLPKI